MRNGLRWTAFLGLIGALILVDNGAAQDQGSAITIDPAVSRLASGIAPSLRKFHVNKLVILGLRGPEREVHPFGGWVADELAASFKRDFPEFQVIADGRSFATEPGVAEKDDSGWTEANEWARKLGAEVIVGGSFARLSRGVGVSLMATKVNGHGQIGSARGWVPMSDEIGVLSVEPIPTFKGVAKAGIAGTGIPACIFCPTPEFSDKARAAKFDGVVVLRVVVTRDGDASDITVIKGPGMGLEENAIQAVRKWRFKPALSAEGDVVDAVVPIEVNFKIYRGPHSP